MKTGDLVYGHDRKVYPVTGIWRRRYSGTIIGISHDQTPEPLWLTANHLVLTARRVQQLTPEGNWSGIPVSHIHFARQMRHQATPPEAHLWKRLRGNQLGVPFRRQHPIGPYIADFYCRQASLVVEVDGIGTHTSAEAKEYDAHRDTYLSALGLHILRFTASDVSHRTDAVIEAILHAAQETVLPNAPEKQWRYAGSLLAGDIVYFGIDLRPVAISHLAVEETTEEVYDLEVTGAPSLLTNVCAIHDCSAGITAALRERGSDRIAET